jgi:hypothetical protein
MALTAKETTDIQNSTDGANKITEINRILDSVLESKHLSTGKLDDEGNPLSASEVKKLRDKTINRWKNFNQAGRIRFEFNIDSFTGDDQTLVESSESDFNGTERAHLNAYLASFQKNHTGVNKKMAFHGLRKMNELETALVAVLPLASIGDIRTLARKIARVS